jgi:hypothetical protein
MIPVTLFAEFVKTKIILEQMFISKIMTEGSDDLSVNINHKPFECVFQYFKSTKKCSR